jgi:hypothetical protein
MIKNFILETTNAPGSATTVNLAGAPAGRMTWSLGFTNGSPVYYFMDDGTQAEWGNGVFNTGTPNTITRTAVIGNTLGTTARLNFTGSTRIYNDIPAERLVWSNPSLVTTVLGAFVLAGSITGATTYNGSGNIVTTGGQVMVGAAASGKVALNSGGVSNAGLLGFYAINGTTRLGYIGFGPLAGGAINLVAESPMTGFAVTGNFNIVTGQLQVAGNQVLSITGGTYTGPLNITGFAASTASGAGQLNPAGVATGVGGSINWSIFTAQAIWATTFLLAGSDRRIKQKISEITGEQAIAWVMGGRAVTFEKHGQWGAGFIAQEEIDNGRGQSITWGDSDDPAVAVPDETVHVGGVLLAKDYNADIAFLTKALQVALVRIAALEARP